MAEELSWQDGWRRLGSAAADECHNPRTAYYLHILSLIKRKVAAEERRINPEEPPDQPDPVPNGPQDPPQLAEEKVADMTHRGKGL